MIKFSESELRSYWHIFNESPLVKRKDVRIFLVTYLVKVIYFIKEYWEQNLYLNMEILKTKKSNKLVIAGAVSIEQESRIVYC